MIKLFKNFYFTVANFSFHLMFFGKLKRFKKPFLGLETPKTYSSVSIFPVSFLRYTFCLGIRCHCVHFTLTKSKSPDIMLNFPFSSCFILQEAYIFVLHMRKITNFDYG